MNLTEAQWLILSTVDKDIQTRRFNEKKFLPESIFKESTKLELSFSTMSNFKECPTKFFVKKILGLGILKIGEALFLGNVVHKFNEDMIIKYTNKAMSIDNFNEDVLSTYNKIQSIFNIDAYPNKEAFVGSTFKYVMGRKKFEPDIFFDDISFIESIADSKSNYVEQNKILFQHAAKLLKRLFVLSNTINAKNFKPEEWLKFKIGDLPMLFIGKVDLIFDYEKDGKAMKSLVDFKTGKKEYFHWDQLNYYSVYYGNDMFENISKYFFDIKECAVYAYSGSKTFESIYYEMLENCKIILNMVDLYNSSYIELKDRYEKKLTSLLKKVNKENIHQFPCELMMATIDILHKDFFKKNKITSYCSKAKPLCKYCDVFSFCPTK